MSHSFTFRIWLFVFMIIAIGADAFPSKKDSYQKVSFDFLGGYETISQYTGYRRSATLTEQPGSTNVPEKILALNGKKISVEGFMVPLEVPDARVKTFLLVRDKASCCFGGPPKVTHRIYVTMDGEKLAEFFPDNVVTVRGTLNIVGSVIEEDAMAVYEMKADEVSVLQK